MDTFNGLPAHPFLVHLPIVLLPILALATVAIAARLAWRDRFGTWVVAGNLVVFVLVWLTNAAGEKLSDRGKFQKLVEKHEDLANTTRLLTLLLLVTSALLVLVMPRLARRAEPAPSWAMPVTLVLRALSVAFAVLAVIWLVRTGHEGARVVWEPFIEETS